MRSVRFVFLAILLMASAAVASADGLADPKMIVSDPPCFEGPCPGPVGLTFSFRSNAFGGGFLTFTNESDFDWTSLLIETGSDPFNVPANTIVCQTNAFLSCVVSDLGGGITAMYLSGVTAPGCEFGCANGIPDFDTFTINLNGEANDPVSEDPNGSGGWGALRNFDASANVPAPVPEPATLTLMAVGMGAFLAKKRLSRKRSRS